MTRYTAPVLRASLGRLVAFVAIAVLAATPAARAACAAACLTPAHAGHGAMPRPVRSAPAEAMSHVHHHGRAATDAAATPPNAMADEIASPPCCTVTGAAVCRDRGTVAALAPRAAAPSAPLPLAVAMPVGEARPAIAVRARSIPPVRPPGTASAPLPLRI